MTASNADGSNCPGEVGTIQYSTLGVIPSNKKDARVWDLKASGTLKPHDKDYIIHYDLSKVEYDGKVTFENPLSGVITVCGRVISISNKNATWFPCEETKTVSIILDQSRWGFSIKKETPFSMDIQLDDDDDATPTQCMTCFINNYYNIDIDDFANRLISVSNVRNCTSQISSPPEARPFTQQICISYIGTDGNNYFATPSYFKLTFTMKYYDTAGNEVSSTNSRKSSFYQSSKYSWSYQKNSLLVQNNQML